MLEVFIKKKWDEGNILFYLHFVNNEAVRQMEIHEDKTVRFSLEKPVTEDGFLCDACLSDLDLDEDDYITKEEFETMWRTNI